MTETEYEDLREVIEFMVSAHTFETGVDAEGLATDLARFIDTRLVRVGRVRENGEHTDALIPDWDVRDEESMEGWQSAYRWKLPTDEWGSEDPRLYQWHPSWKSGKWVEEDGEMVWRDNW